MGRKNKANKMFQNNYKFVDSAILNDLTYQDYLARFKKIATIMFEWVNLPTSMNARWIEECLYRNGQACFLNTKDYGFINTNCSSSGKINIYELPTKLNCYSFEFQSLRNLYTGVIPKNEYSDCILVMNNYDRVPTCISMELFSYRLYLAQRTCDVNINAQKTPIMLVVNEKQRLLMEQLYNQYNGNQPFIFGDKDQLSENMLRSINTGAPFVADKVSDYKKEIWNEALTFLGINNIMVDKKERLVSDEANSNNELINLNLQSFLAPRQEACKQFNERYGLKGTDKEISVRVRSDLHNIIKQLQSSTSDLEKIEENIKEKEVVVNE